MSNINVETPEGKAAEILSAEEHAGAVADQ
jgi:hypothetical protein